MRAYYMCAYSMHAFLCVLFYVCYSMCAIMKDTTTL